MISSLDFKDFFSQEKNYVLICCNDQTVKDTFGVEDKETYRYLYFWHFISFDKETQKHGLLKFVANPQFNLEGTKVDVVEIHKRLRRLHDLWKEQFSVPFPDIIIKGLKGSASYSPGEPGRVVLTIEEIMDLDRLDFVFSHELGHYFYNQNIKKEAEESVLSLSYYKGNKGLYLFLAMALYNVATSVYILFEETTPFFIKIAIVVANALALCYLGYFEMASWLSWKKRVKNYTQEFYADHFAQRFLGIKVKRNSPNERFIGQVFDFNVYTHPRGDLRLDSLEINKNSTYFQWQNPVVLRHLYFRRSSFYEVVEFWRLQFKKVKNIFRRS